MQKNKNIPIDHSDRWELLFHQDYMEFFKLKADLHKMQLYLWQHRRTRKRKGPAGRFHLAGHIYAIPSALQPH